MSGFKVKFVRDGAATALISIPQARNLAYQAIDRLSAVASGLLPNVLALNDVPDFVTDAAREGLEQGVASLEAIRETNPVDPAVSSRVRDANDALFSALPAAMTGDKPAISAATAALIDNARAIGDGLDPVIAQRAFSEMASAHERVAAVAYLSPMTRLADLNAVEADRVARLAALIAWSDALLARPYASRPEGITARAEVAERFDREAENATGADYAPLYVAIAELRGRIAEYLTRLIADLAPVVTIEAAISQPSLVWAYRLYQDPARAGELVARNSVSHPSFLPQTFAALAR